MRVTARDNRGGTGMRRVELHVDGRQVRTWGGGTVRSSWFGFRRLGYGAHAVEIRALDQAQNVSVRRLTVRKVAPSSFGDSAAPRVTWRGLPRRAGARLRLAVRVADRGVAGLRKITLYVDGVRVRTTKRGDGLWRPVVRLRGPRQAPDHGAGGGPRGERGPVEALRDAPVARRAARLGNGGTPPRDPRGTPIGAGARRP